MFLAGRILTSPFLLLQVAAPAGKLPARIAARCAAIAVFYNNDDNARLLRRVDVTSRRCFSSAVLAALARNPPYIS